MQPGFHSWLASQWFRGRPGCKANGPKKLSAVSSFKRLEGRRTDLMANKCYASTMLLLRIGVLAAQIAVSPSAAAQYRDFLVSEGGRRSISCAISHVRERTMIVCGRAEKRTRSSPQAN